MTEVTAKQHDIMQQARAAAWGVLQKHDPEGKVLVTNRASSRTRQNNIPLPREPRRLKQNTNSSR